MSLSVRMLVVALGVAGLASFSDTPSPAQEKPKIKLKINPKVIQRGPAIPTDQPEPRDVDRHKKFVEIAKRGDVDVLFVGDSITQGWEGAGKEAWKKHFEPLKAANFGIGGDRTQHVIWRITYGKELEGINPKLCVMMIGTNNTGPNSAADIAKGIEAILKEFKKQKPEMKVLLLGVFPRAGGIGKDDKVAPKEKLNPKIAQINAIIEKFADGKTVFYKDIGGKFLNKDGGLPKELMPDLLHLSPKGYDIWAEAIKDDVVKLMK